MKKNRHTGKHAGYNAGICLLAGVFLVCTVFLIRNGQMEYPKNPLKEQITEATELLQKDQASLDGDSQQEENEERTQSEEPKTSSEPEKSEEPKRSSEPKESEEPKRSSEPKESEEPKNSSEPKESEEPKNSSEPKESEEPIVSSEPKESEESKTSSEPENSSEPKESEEPIVSSEPKNSSEPKESEDPKDSGGNIKESDIPGTAAPAQSKGPGQGGRPGDGPYDGPVTDKVYFTTSIRDGEVVTESDYAFIITHKDKELKVEEEQVYVNGLLWPQFHGRVLLEDGENTIRVAVRYIEKDQRVFTVYKDYVVILKRTQKPVASPSKEPEPSAATPPFSEAPKISAPPFVSEKPVMEPLFIVSSLENQTVYGEDFTFEAYVQGGMGHAVLEVKLNGAPITGEGTYTVRLKIGENRIRLRAFEEVDGQLFEVVKQAAVTYVPVATEETRPYIAYINVTQGMTTIGDKFVLDVLPKDYLGNRIYAEGIQVRLNEKEYSYMWANEYTSYDLKLQAGENKLDIRVTDKDGRYADYRYTIWCDWVKDGDPIGTAVISVDADVLGIGFLMEVTEVTVYQGEALSFVIQRALEEAGFFVEHNGTLESGFYLSRIARDGIGRNVEIPGELVDAINDDGLEWKEQCFEDSLGEFDYCQGSGWVYSVNGHFTNYSPSQCFLKDGDVVRIRFTLAYGRDVGAGMEGKNYGITWLQ